MVLEIRKYRINFAYFGNESQIACRHAKYANLIID